MFSIDAVSSMMNGPIALPTLPDFFPVGVCALLFFFFKISLLDAEDPDQPSENVTQSNSAQSESQLLAHISHNVLLGNLTGPQLSESDGEQFSETSLTIATGTYLPA